MKKVDTSKFGDFDLNRTLTEYEMENFDAFMAFHAIDDTHDYIRQQPLSGSAETASPKLCKYFGSLCCFYDETKTCGITACTTSDNGRRCRTFEEE